MEMDRDTRREILVGTGSVAVFIVLLVAVGTVYSNDGLTQTGALAVVGVIVFFVLLMTALGIWMSRQY